MISVLKCFKHSPIKINQNNKNIYSKFRFPGALVSSYDFKNNVLLNKFKECMEVTTSSVNKWYTYFSSPNEAKHLKDVLIKQQHLQKMQDERREIGKLITDVRKLYIEKQDKIFLIKRWENIHEYVNLRKEEAELIKKEHELAAKFEALDKIEKEHFAVLNNTVRGSYEREKAKIVYTKYWGRIITIITVMLIGVICRITPVEEPFYAADNFKTQMNAKTFYVSDNLKTQTNEVTVTVILGAISLVVMIIICGSCR